MPFKMINDLLKNYVKLINKYYNMYLKLKIIFKIELYLKLNASKLCYDFTIKEDLVFSSIDPLFENRYTYTPLQKP